MSQGRVAAAHPRDLMFPQHFHVCANVDFIPATGPCNLSPQCALHTFLSLQHDPSCLATLKQSNSFYF